MADNFDVIVDLVMDEEAQRRVISGASTVEKEFQRLEERAKKTGRTLVDVWEANNEALRDVVDSVKELEEAQRKQAQEAAESARRQAAIFSGQASMLNAQARAFTLRSAELQRIQGQVASISRGLLVAGSALSLGIFKFASDYVANAKEATELTLKWKRAQDSLTESQTRLGRLSAQAALPILEQVARLAEKAATFMETHPELVSSALNVGLITAGLGALGILVSKGIKLYADILYLQAVPLQQQAASLQLLASEQMLVAAQLQAEAAGVEVAENLGGGAAKLGKGAAFFTLLGQGAVLLGSFVGGLVAADKAFDAIEKRDVQFKDYMVELKQIVALTAGSLGWISQGIANVFRPQSMEVSGTDLKWFEATANALGLLKDASDETGESLEELAGGLQASEAFEQVLGAYEKYKADDLKLVQDHYAERRDIVADGLKDEAAAGAQYRSSIASLGADTQKQLAALQKNYQQQSIKEEQQYLEKRAEITRNAGEDVARIEEELRERLRKNRLEHEQRSEDLIAGRDALGLAKENRRFEAQQAEERRQANLEVRRMRQDLARRLQELEAQYAAERAQRYQEFVQRAIEIKQQAAERAKELAAQHAEEIRKIKEQTAARLKEADAQFIAERRRKYDYFVQQIRDLDANLLGERNLRLQYQKAMITDLEAFLARYKSGQASILNASLPPKAEGGYTLGPVNTGEKGYEWIATHKSTQAAEAIIGGRLTQDVFVKAMQALKAGTNATYVDNRRMEVSMSRESKEAYREGAKQALMELLGV